MKQMIYSMRIRLNVEELQNMGLITCPEELINQMTNHNINEIPFQFSKENVSEDEEPRTYIYRRVTEITHNLLRMNW